MGCSEKMTIRNVTFTVAFVAATAALVSVVVVLANDKGESKIIRGSTSPWTWECNTVTELCEKTEHNESSPEPQLSFETCKIACGSTGRLWPAPTGFTNLTTVVARVSPSKFTFQVQSPPSTQVETFLKAAYAAFEQKVVLLAGQKPVDESYVGMEVVVQVQSNSLALGYDTDESYKLVVSTGAQKQPVATISASSAFGARHGLETLFQLMAYDEFFACYNVVSEAEVNDSPFYKHRGIAMDTSRNYFPMPDLKRLVDAMSMNKLNVLHWHMTDTHSFPFVSKRRPQMSIEGAYSAEEVYTMEEIKDFVDYARVRGVKIIPELDAPAHCGNGWRWGEKMGLGEMVWCANSEPWYDLCVEPPCGQLNPLNDNVFDVLEDIYADWAELFDKDIVHLGGDELSKQCWENQPSIQAWMAENATDIPDVDDARLIHLWWHTFEKRAEERLAKAYGSDSANVILWTSGLTQHAEKYLNPSKHIIQVWTEFNNSEIGNLVKKGFRLIMSNYDSLYLDCGFQSWVGEGHNWCAPYKTWQQIHDNDPKTIISDLVGADFAELDRAALGAEVALWTEQADPSNFESRLWPRSAAFAERMWSRPSGKRGNKVAWRLQAQRQRMVQMGIKADAMVPAWCVQNEGQCFLASGKIVETDTGGI